MLQARSIDIGWGSRGLRHSALPAYIHRMVKDLRDIERSWVARDQQQMRDPSERTKRLIGWWLLTVFLCGAWGAGWLGWGNDLGGGLQRLYGVTPAEAQWWLRADAHLHAMMGALVTVWGAWAGRLFTPVGFWLGPPVAVVVVIVDEVIQIGQEGRSFEWGDILAGCAGILIATIATVVLAKWRSRVRDGSTQR